MNLPRANVLALLGPALACVAIGCGGGGSGDATNNGTGSPDNWSVAGTASDPNPTIQQAAADTITVTVTRAGGYTGSVTLTPIVAAPGGITARIDNIATVNNVTTARIIILIGPSFPAGPQSVNVAVQPDGGVPPISVEITVNIVNKPGVFVIVAPTLSVGQGSIALAPVTIRRTSYDLPVPMTLATTQAGLTATFSPNPATDSATTMSLQADVSVPQGTYSVGVRANEGTTFQATAPLTLTVTPPGSIVLGLGLNPLIVRIGSSTPTGLTITRSNYSGPVTLTFSGVPGGVTVTPVANPTSVSSTSITFAVPGSPTPGTYPITITGSAPGIQSASVIQMLTISP